MINHHLNKDEKGVKGHTVNQIVPNYHIRTAQSAFGDSIFSGTSLKVNTKMETDVKRVKLLTLFCVFSQFLVSSSRAKHER